MARLKFGDIAACQELMAYYSRRLLPLARASLHHKSIKVFDEEDVVQSALAGFLKGVEQGRYQLRDREELWQILAKMTVKSAGKIVLQQHRQKRAPRRGEGPAATRSVERITDPNLSPDSEAQVKEEINHLLNGLRDTQLRSIAKWKWEGYTNEEIATMLGCSVRTVQRRLRFIRIIWEDEP
jgi:RNA polymerase sigma factor (sigma-70 family)